MESSRSTGIPIYVYRVGENPTSGSTAGIFERLATQSGGRVFTRAGFDGLRGALSSLADDLESTWLVEVDLPGDAAAGEDRELSLETEDAAAELRYQRYWRGGNRDSVLAAMLELGDADARYWAASQLMGSSSRDLLERLLETFRGEPVVVNRLVEVSAIYNMTATLLLHGGVEDQETALAVVESLHEIHPILIRRLRPALEVFQKTEPPRKLRKRARRAYRLPTVDRDSPARQKS